MMNTFDECCWFWQRGRKRRSSLLLDPRYVADFRADVCHRQATLTALMRPSHRRPKAVLPGARDGLMILTNAV
jgi:hypothetical protein